MRGPHDLGGMDGFGPVAPEPNEPIFHAAWEKRALGVVLANGAIGEWSIDQSRASREKLPPVAYWSLSYYEIWLAAMAELLKERGLVSLDELATGHSQRAPRKVAGKKLNAADVPAVLARGSPYTRPITNPAKFSIGEKIRTVPQTHGGHTRLPGYATDKAGEVVAVHGNFAFADASARGDKTASEWLYSVQFKADELWANDSKDTVCLDLWEPYLEKA
jgi:nitrile hydratase beta subunit